MTDRQAEAVNAVRHLTAKRAENWITVRPSRRRSVVGLDFASAVAPILITATAVVISLFFASASEMAVTVVTGVVVIFVRATLWPPWEKLG